MPTNVPWFEFGLHHSRRFGVLLGFQTLVDVAASVGMGSKPPNACAAATVIVLL